MEPGEPVPELSQGHWTYSQCSAILPLVNHFFPFVMKKYQELEAKLAELQQEVERLKKEEKNSLPEDFKRGIVLEILNNPLSNHTLLYHAFIWDSTTQGRNYWDAICNGEQTLNYVAVIQLQKWVILSYQQEYGN